jgi:hypothetical protein
MRSKKSQQLDQRTCEGCIHFRLPDPSDEIGVCHRYPRVWIMRDDKGGGWAYPEQHTNDEGCGEFSRLTH